MSTYRPPSIKKCFDVLSAISKAKGGLSLSEIARTLNMSKATVHGLVGVLKDMGVLIQDIKSKRFLLGPTILELGKVSLSQLTLWEIARPAMRELMEETKGTVYLGILNNRHVTILDVVESTADMKITSARGSTVPIFAAALGKVMLGFLEEKERAELLRFGLPKYTERSIVDPGTFLKEIEKATLQGYAVDLEEYISGVWAVAAPVRNWMGIPAAIWVVGFRASLEEKGIDEIAELTKRTAQYIDDLLKS